MGTEIEPGFVALARPFVAIGLELGFAPVIDLEFDPEFDHLVAE